MKSTLGILRVALGLALALGLAAPAAAQLKLIEFATGFSKPLGMVQDPTDPSVQYVLEKFGRIWTLKNGVRQPDPFLDLSEVVYQDANGERGLLGLAFPPDAATSGRAFVFFSSQQGLGESVIARFTRISGKPLVLDPATRFDLEFGPFQRFIAQPGEMHKGGKLAFGPDGYLYVAVGDGGPWYDPENHAQNVSLLLGKILRIDVNVPDADPIGYVVPSTNPFVSVAEPAFARPEIWALGLRNPWRITFDDPVRGGTGGLLIADVGQDFWEEINYQPPGVGGRNFGWSIKEGLHDLVKPAGTPPATEPVVQPLIDPIFEYGHGGLFGNSITGGYVYRGSDLAPSYKGRYFFADFIFKRLFSMPLNVLASSGEAERVPFDEVVSHTDTVGGQSAVGMIASIDVDARGELYLVDYVKGRITKLVMDSDSDGLPDGWETLFELNPNSALGANGATGDPDADGKTNAQELADGTHPFNVRELTRYLAEGSSSAFFETTIDLTNPGTQPAAVLLRFLRQDGVVITHPVTVPGEQHVTVRPGDLIGLQVADFSTVIETNRLIVAERTMVWTRTGRYGSSTEHATTSPSTTWYLAEGATHGAFDTFYLVENPTEEVAELDIAYLRPEGMPIAKSYTLDPHARMTIWVDEEMPELHETDVSARVIAMNDVPVIVERAMYRSGVDTPFGAGHASAGVTSLSTRWFFAEGATGSFFDLFLLLANPGATNANVTVQYLLPDGQAPIVKTYTLSRESRQTFNVEIEDPRLTDTAVAMVVESSVPIVAERAMYWPGPSGDGWQESHNSPGATETGTLWAVGGGEEGGSYQAQTYVLVANTSAFAGTAKVMVLREGALPLTREFPLPANSRVNVPIGSVPEFAAAIDSRFGVLVESLGAASVGQGPAQIVVEHATYSNDSTGRLWAAGSNAIGTKLR